MAGGWFLQREDYGDKAESRFPQIAGIMSAVAWVAVLAWGAWKLL